jgi:hypothetical protein
MLVVTCSHFFLYSAARPFRRAQEASTGAVEHSSDGLLKFTFISSSTRSLAGRRIKHAPLFENVCRRDKLHLESYRIDPIDSSTLSGQ